jgi:hypothetical protein
MKRAGRILNALIDDVNSGKTQSTKRDLKALHSMLRIARNNAVKFIVPYPDEIRTDQPLLANDLRPPYLATLMEFDFNTPDVSGMLLAMDTGDRVLLFVASRSEVGDDQMWYMPPALVFAEYSDASAIGDEPIWHSQPLFNDRVDRLIEAKGHDIEEAAKFTLLGAMKFICVYTSVCQTLKHRHVETVDIEPDAKENRVRRIKGKAPLFTYKTLVIGEPKPQTKTRKGGTHASPRSHLRRGHYRTGKNGNRYWVSAAFVNGAPGFVHKDYELRIGAQ